MKYVVRKLGLQVQKNGKAVRKLRSACELENVTSIPMPCWGQYLKQVTCS